MMPNTSSIKTVTHVGINLHFKWETKHWTLIMTVWCWFWSTFTTCDNVYDDEIAFQFEWAQTLFTRHGREICACCSYICLHMIWITEIVVPIKRSNVRDLIKQFWFPWKMTNRRHMNDRLTRKKHKYLSCFHNLC